MNLQHLQENARLDRLERRRNTINTAFTFLLAVTVIAAFVVVLISAEALILPVVMTAGIVCGAWIIAESFVDKQIEAAWEHE